MSPVVTALREDLALPDVVFGPQESWALAWLAACLAGESCDSGAAAGAAVRSG